MTDNPTYGPFEALIAAVEQHGGWVNREVFGIQQFEGMGFGAVALTAIASDEPLFRIPLDYMLTPFTSELKSHLELGEWESLGEGWSRLILVMMWESSREQDSPWAAYLRSLPTEFDTPIFWPNTRELTGTDIEHRIGKDEAEEEYQTRIKPLLISRPELFPPGPHFTMEAFHMQGSRILSRSFTIPLIDSGGQPEVDDDSDESFAVVMVPIADILNAAYERDNARLHRESAYCMIAVRAISKGEQILNTYGHPPNSELLRKYGHVDVLPLPDNVLKQLDDDEIGDWPYGNAGDEVMISGDLLLEATGKSSSKERIDWWLEDGGEDAFVLTYDEPIEDDLISFVRLLLFDDEWDRSRTKGKTPRPVLDAQVAEIIQLAINKRFSRYRQSLQDDIRIIQASDTHTPAYKSAVVRLGEKRLLSVARRIVSGMTVKRARR